MFVRDSAFVNGAEMEQRRAAEFFKTSRKSLKRKRAGDGIEPATSSLGNWIAIENKTHRVHGALSESIVKHKNRNIRKASS